MVDGEEDVQHNGGTRSSAHAVSADGSRVFFTDNCTHDLYMRVDGTQTVDIGAYTFLFGSAEDSTILLEKSTAGGTYELVLYNTETETAKPLLSQHNKKFDEGRVKASEDLSVIYFDSG